MGFCSRVELMSPLTSSRTYKKPTMDIVALLQCLHPLLTSHHPAPMQSDSVRAPGDDRTYHHARHVPLGGHRRQLSHHPALFRHGHPVGHPVSLNLSLRHEVARLIVWHMVVTRPAVPSAVSYADVREGNDLYRACGHGTHSHCLAPEP